MKLTVTTTTAAPEENATAAVRLGAPGDIEGRLVLMIVGEVHTVGLTITLADAERLETQLRTEAAKERARRARG